MSSKIIAGNATNQGIVASGATDGILELQSGSTPTTAVTIDASQNVGIGTSSVASGRKFQVEASGDTVQRINSGGASNGVALEISNAGTVRGTVGNGAGAISGGSATTMAVQAVNELIFASGGYSERARFDTSGNLLVGTTSNIAGEKINATNSASSGAFGVYIKYSGSAPNGNSNEFLYCSDTSTVRAAIKSNGGLNNYQANNSNLSDQREKKDIELAGNYLDKVCAIPVKTFLFNDQTDTELNLGVIAQDVQAVAPELVSESDWSAEQDGSKMRLSIYQTDLQYALMKAIQELNAKVEAQAAEIQALKGTK